MTAAIASLSLDLAPDATGGAPADAHLLPAGAFRAVDGRPYDIANWVLSERIAAQVIARAEARKSDILIDYEHQSLHAEWNGQPAPAAGWFRELAWRDGGLYATGIKWTDRAAQMIASREYRYISAVFSYLPSTGEVLEIISVAITNTPALDGLEALIAARRTNSTQENTMTDDVRLAALTNERDAAAAQVAALTKERDAIAAELAALKAKVKADAQAAEQAEHAEVLKQALISGVITPAEREALSKAPLALLKELLAARPSAALLTRQADGKPAPATAVLTREEAEYCAKLGISPDQFLKAKGA
ncbi:MAG: phage protease [Azoarcus sp.]|jgi:phage I-like protein|nr:phage protease [Azoarcus sp.]